MKQVSLLVTMGLASVALFSCKNSDTNKKSDDKTTEQKSENSKKLMKFALDALSANGSNASVVGDVQCGDHALEAFTATIAPESGIPYYANERCAVNINTVTIGNHVYTATTIANRLALEINEAGNVLPTNDPDNNDKVVSGEYTYTLNGNVQGIRYLTGVKNVNTNGNLRIFSTENRMNTVEEVLRINQEITEVNNRLPLKEKFDVTALVTAINNLNIRSTPLGLNQQNTLNTRTNRINHEITTLNNLGTIPENCRIVLKNPVSEELTTNEVNYGRLYELGVHQTCRALSTNDEPDTFPLNWNRLAGAAQYIITMDNEINAGNPYTIYEVPAFEVVAVQDNLIAAQNALNVANQNIENRQEQLDAANQNIENRQEDLNYEDDEDEQATIQTDIDENLIPARDLIQTDIDENLIPARNLIQADIYGNLIPARENAL